MADIFTKEKRSEIMSKIRSKNTKLELVVFRFLRGRGVHFQRHYRRAAGTPDVAVPSRKLAVFVDGDFWHGYRYPAWKRKLKPGFWRQKIERNRARDRRNFAALRRAGWLVLRVWEHEVLKDPFAALVRVERFLRGVGRPAGVAKRRKIA